MAEIDHRRFKEVIGVMEQNGADLAEDSVFDLKSQTVKWNITPNKERAYMLQDIVEANRHWSGK
jgi:hypothetical protein